MKILQAITLLLLPVTIATAENPPVGDSDPGADTRGLALRLWTSTPVYSVNSTPDLWLTLSNNNYGANGKIIPYDVDKVGFGYIDIIDSHGNKTVISHFDASDGPIEYGFDGGLGGILQRKQLPPETYTLQWKIGELQSNIITMRVEEVESEIE